MRIHIADENEHPIDDPVELMKAIELSNAFRVALIVEHMPHHINFQDQLGLSPAHLAIFNQNIEICRVLLRTGSCDLAVRDKFGRSPVDMLQYTTDENLFNLVISHAFPEFMSDVNLNQSSLNVDDISKPSF